MFLTSKESAYTDMFDELTWYSLEALAKKKLGSKHGLTTLKKKRDWAVSQGWQIVENKQGVEGVAFSSMDEGVMKMRVGSKFAQEKVRKETFESSEDNCAHARVLLCSRVCPFVCVR